MATVEWTPDLSVSVPSIDAEHQGLLRLINALHEAIAGGQTHEVLSRVLARLTFYSVQHFGHEEKLMEESGYEGFASHKAEHDAFVEKLGEFKAGFNNGLAALPEDVLAYLQEWLIGHIQGTDRAYSDYFVERGFR